MLLLRGLVPPTLGGAKDQLPKIERDGILLVASNVLGHGDLHTASAYFGTFRGAARGDGLGCRVGPVLILDAEADVFALLHCNPAPIKGPDGSYRMQTASERRETRVTAVVEKLGEQDRQIGVDQFISEFPHLTEKVRKHLVVVGLGL
jgi:hypothetical protein